AVGDGVAGGYGGRDFLGVGWVGDGVGEAGGTMPKTPLPDGRGSLGDSTCQQNPTVTIDGIDAPVQFAGLAPGFIGAYQLNVTVPSGVRSGTASLVVTA